MGFSTLSTAGLSPTCHTSFPAGLVLAKLDLLEIEKKRIHQNTARLLLTDQNQSCSSFTNRNRFTSAKYVWFFEYDRRMYHLLNPGFIRTGNSFFDNAESNINAMLKAFSLASLFITVTFSERWEQFRKFFVVRLDHHFSLQIIHGLLSDITMKECIIYVTPSSSNHVIMVSESCLNLFFGMNSSYDKQFTEKRSTINS
jgi:hypothetical protein